MPKNHILAIDQGTTSSRAIVFDQSLNVCATAQQEFTQHFPQSGWVEHDPQDILRTVIDTSHDAMAEAQIAPSDLAAIGITNQRETTLIWDRETGKPIYNAIVWQDRRTAQICAAHKTAGHELGVIQKTGLLLDPYFSASKITWLLDNVSGAREAANQGRLAFGTVDSYLVWHLTGGARHVTDATNASRTMLFNIHDGKWDPELLELFNIPGSLLPEVMDNAADFGSTETTLFGANIPISGIAGDQQAATIGQACFVPGMIKSTYGTGCFALLNTGDTPVVSANRLLTTIAYQIDGKPTYALEGSIFVAGAAVQWLRDGLKMIDNAAQSGELAAAADDGQAVVLVPAFTGLGAPYWDAECRGAIFGLTRNSGPAELARATLESVCYQTRDLLDAMHRDMASSEGKFDATVLRVDGGMVASDWTMQRLSDLLDAPVDRPKILETTALGAAYLAGYHVGLCPGPQEFAQTWALDRRFEPEMDTQTRDSKYGAWKDAVRRTLST